MQITGDTMSESDFIHKVHMYKEIALVQRKIRLERSDN